MRTLGLTQVLGRASLPAAVAVAVLLIGGCSGGGDTPAGQGAGPTTTAGSASAAGVVLTVTGTEYSFGPSTLKAAAGSTTIRFTNEGAVEHDFTIKALGVKLTAQPGKTAETTVTLAPGTYKSVCSVPGHSQSGMQGSLTVS